MATHPFLQDDALYTHTDHLPPVTPDLIRQRWTAHEGRVSPAGSEALLGWTVLNADDGTPMGWVDATLAAAKKPGGAIQATNLGYLMLMRTRGQGIATEAAGAVVEHLFGNGIQSICATVTVGNLASARVLQKLGFEQIAMLPRNGMARGVHVDEWAFGLTRQTA